MSTNSGEVPVVAKANNVEHANVVTHADSVEKVEIRAAPVRSDKERRLYLIREIARNCLSICALLVMIIVIFDKNSDANAVRGQLRAFQAERTAADLETESKLECARRYNDVIEQANENQLILIGEFLVTITQISPGPERENAVKSKIEELKLTNFAARDAVVKKVEYNNKGNPLPCPLQESIVPQLSSDGSVTTTP